MRRMQIFVAGTLLALLASNSLADNLDDQLAGARELLSAGKRKEAAEKFEALKSTIKQKLDKDAENAHLCYLYGAISMDGGNDEDAATYLDKAVKLDPKNKLYLNERAKLFLYSDKPNEAVVLLKQVAELDPKSADAWTSLANAQSIAKHYQDAEASLQKAIAISPKEPRYVGMVAEIQLDEGKTAEALQTYKSAVALDPKYVMGWMNIGQIEQTAGHYSESLAAYESGLHLAPDDGRAVAKEVQLYTALKKDKERDVARDRIFALHKAGKMDDPLYCREQVKAGQFNMMVFEYFEMKGPHAIHYSFIFLDKDGKTVKKVSLGSYDDTTEIAREMGEIKKDERMYHLDEYSPNRHATLGMFKKEPTYDETRKMIDDYNAGKLKELSSSQTAGGKKDGGK